MKANNEGRRYLLDFYPSEGVYFHCQLISGNFGEGQKQYSREQAYFSQCPTPYSQCPTPNSQCPAPD